MQVVFALESEQPHLWWSRDITPCAIVDTDFTIDRIANCAQSAFSYWRDHPDLNPKRADGFIMRQGDELKFTPQDLRMYLDPTRASKFGTTLATALVAEESLTHLSAPNLRSNDVSRLVSLAVNENFQGEDFCWLVEFSNKESKSENDLAEFTSKITRRGISAEIAEKLVSMIRVKKNSKR